MKEKSQYTSAETNACLSVIVELITYLYKYSKHLVLVGGWAPYFLYNNSKAEKMIHVGSLDVDLALNFFLIPEQDYQTIADILNERGYKNRKDRTGKIIHASYERSFLDENNIKQTVQIDFLAAEYGGSGKKRRHQKIQEILARKGRGIDLVFNDCVEREIKARIPNGAVNKVKIKVANLCSIIATKGFAFYERGSEKDAYDIYWLFRNHPEEEKGIIQELSKMKGNKLVTESLDLIKERFRSLDSLGPVAVATFLDPMEDEEREIIIRDSYETINRLLKHI